MNAPFLAEIPATIAAELQRFLQICEASLILATQEGLALNSPAEYAHGEFAEQRKNLLPNLETALISLRNQRALWMQCHPAERERCDEVKLLFQKIQGILTKILFLDRENQQAMLRRGLMPAHCVPATAAQQPNYVASVYQRHRR